MVYKSIRASLQRLFPPQCLLCLDHSGATMEICPACRATLPWLGHHCRCCALPLATANAELCGRCLQRPPRFHQCLCALNYRFPVDSLLADFKHHAKPPSGRLLAQLWLERCSAAAAEPLPDALVPVPLHWRRRWQRGYNQSLLVSQFWGSALAIPVADLLRRQHATPPQQGLTAAERRRNMKNAFPLANPDRIRGKHLALVDDVLTTGTTANAAAAILLRAGATRVDVWCLARTPAPGQ